MQTIYDDLLTELERSLIEIENNKSVRMMKCSQKITICNDAARELRASYFKANLRSALQQIHFFKEVKPKVFSELNYQEKIFHYYNQKPKGSLKNQSRYINICLDKVSYTLNNYQEFNIYWQMNATHLDELYFTRRDYDPKLHGSLKHPVDIAFSSPADTTLSRILAAMRYLQFLKNELYALTNPTLDPSWKHISNLQWQGSKTEMVELVYALHASGAIKGELKGVVAVFEQIFRVDLGNFYRTYTDIKYKKKPTSFLDALKSSLIEKIRLENE
jgi:hypothetical protein